MNVPKLRFKEFDGEWENTKIGCLAEISRGASPRPIQDPKWFDEDSNIGWLRISDVTKQNGRIYNLDQKISILGQQKTRVLIEPHLLLSIAATVGKPVINYIPTGVHDGFLIFYRPIFNVEFMFQWLEMFRNKWTRYGQPGSQVNLNSDIVKNQEISIPSLKEQDKIAQFFSLIDKQIQLQQQKIDLLQEQKKGYMKKIFNQEIRFKDECGHYYMKWAEYALNDLGETYTGLSGKTKEDFGVGENSFVTYVNVFKNLFAKKFGVEKVILKENEHQNYVETDDIFLTTSSEIPKEVGMASIWKHESSNLHLNSFCFGYRVTNPKVLPDFLAISLRSEYMRKKITILAQGSTRYNISKTELMKEKVNVPCLEEQKRIVEFYLKLDTSIELEKKKLEILKEQKQGFMQQMFI